MSIWVPNIRKIINVVVDGDSLCFEVEAYDDSVEIVSVYTTEIVETEKGKKALRNKPWEGKIPSWVYDQIEEDLKDDPS